MVQRPGADRQASCHSSMDVHYYSYEPDVLHRTHIQQRKSTQIDVAYATCRYHSSLLQAQTVALEPMQRACRTGCCSSFSSDECLETASEMAENAMKCRQDRVTYLIQSLVFRAAWLCLVCLPYNCSQSCCIGCVWTCQVIGIA